MTAGHAANGCGKQLVGAGVGGHRLRALESGAQLAGQVAHDLNNLLCVISAGAEMLRRRVPVDSAAKECINDILGASTRAVALTAQLVAFAVQEHKATHRVDVNDVIKNAEGVIRRLLGTGIRVSLDLSPDPVVVRGHAPHVERILLNLSANARDAMPNGGHLRITTRASVRDEVSRVTRANEWEGRWVLLTVADTGCGMDDGTRRRAFERFFTTKGDRGTGLGLPTVLQLVAACGGSIDVESEPGIGTTFRIRIPQAGAERA